MSTPVSVDPPPRAHLRTDSEQERDLQERLQLMIQMQHAEQDNAGRVLLDGGFEGPIQRPPVPKKIHNVASGNNSTATGSGRLNKSKRTNTEFTDLNKMARTSNTERSQGLPPPSPTNQQGVGRGTLFFSSTYNSRQRNDSSDSQMQGILTMMGGATGTEQDPPRQIYTGYGAVNSSPIPTAGEMVNYPQHLQMPSQQNQRQQQHEFHYGNPDYHDPYDQSQNTGYATRKGAHAEYRIQNSFCAKCCCLYVPIMRTLLQENVRRSFCYGAIDGMLTGSGIVSAFSALQVLSADASWEVRLAVVAFSAAACAADAVCMAIGHVWTSYVVSSGHANERQSERQMFDSNKAEAKARLVDMLLARGMLKIDAMSLADTLEGYPDLFVSTLLGDSLIGSPEFQAEESEEHQPLQWGNGNNGSFVSLGGGPYSWKFPSYGQFNEMEHEPETANLNMVLRESQMEGLFMMLGFATFAVIPSLLWLWLPEAIENPDAAQGSGSVHMAQSNGRDTISVGSLVVSISGIMVWFLGVWKSRFLDSHWVMSGVENVVVLLACVLSAYALGAILSHVFGGADGLTLTKIVT